MIASASRVAGLQARSTLPKASRRSVAVRAAGAAWFPGKEAPAHLAAASTLPGNYGFDPLMLGKTEEAMKWYVQAELQNGRWAMLGVAGILGAELTGHSWYTAGEQQYFADPKVLFAIQIILFHWVEIRRLQDFNSPGSANQDPIFTSNSLPSTGTPGYPGGIFDPAGFSKGNLAELKQKEIKNARLAMIAFLGFVVQHAATGAGPLDNLSAHLADPWSVNFFTNGISVPAYIFGQ